MRVLLLLLLLVISFWGFVAYGPGSLRSRYEATLRRLQSLARASEGPPPDLGRLPAPVAAYVRRSGAAILPRPTGVIARWRGRIRGGPDQPWMPFTAEQVNSFGSLPGRAFWMSARRGGLPVDVCHRFVGDAATFEARLLGVFPVARGVGAWMARAETVTILNDFCMLAPGALSDPALRWEAVDAVTARVHFDRGEQTVTAVLHFDETGHLVGFESDDRLRGAPDGRSGTAAHWSTPFAPERPWGALRIPAGGEARWREADGREEPYIQMELVDLRAWP